MLRSYDSASEKYYLHMGLKQNPSKSIKKTIEEKIETFVNSSQFEVSFFSGSRPPLALKSSSKSHQMTSFFIQNEN